MLSGWWRRGKWAGIIDGDESLSSEHPRKVLRVHNYGRGWSEIDCGHSLKDLGHTVEAGSCLVVAVTSSQGGKHRPRGNRPGPPGN